MKKSALIGLFLVLGLLVLGGSAFAHGFGYGGGMGGPGMMGYGPGYMGYGPGHMWGYGPEVNNEFTKETTETWNLLRQKQYELNTVLTAPEPDRDKATALQTEINTLRNKLADSRLQAEIEWRKNNPDQTRGNGYGPGYGRGFGPGYCWQ